jgi:putative redox protein
MVTARLDWEQKMAFDATVESAGGQFKIPMDTIPPMGTGTAPTPKQLLLSAIMGCTAMDVIALLKKYRQEVEAFSIEAEADLTETHPKIFSYIELRYRFSGQVEVEKAKEACHLSLSKYCGVSAMVSKAVPIKYSIEINGTHVHYAQAAFDF